MDTEREETTETTETLEPEASVDSEETVEPEAKAEPPAAGTKVEVGTLEPDQLFTLERKEYVVSAVYPFGVMAVPPKTMKNRKGAERLPLDTMVTVK